MRTPRFLLRGFPSPRALIGHGLGPLERRVMECLWQAHDSTVRDVGEQLGDGVAYTTVMTTLDRLFKKGLLARRKTGRAYLYSPAASKEEFDRVVSAGLVETLFERCRDEPLPLLSNLVDAVSDRDRQLLDELERLVRAKRDALGEQGRS